MNDSTFSILHKASDKSARHCGVCGHQLEQRIGSLAKKTPGALSKHIKSVSARGETKESSAKILPNYEGELVPTWSDAKKLAMQKGTVDSTTGSRRPLTPQEARTFDVKIKQVKEK
jgi:hypothetical protein